MDGSGKPAEMAGAPGLTSERRTRIAVELLSQSAGQFSIRCRMPAGDLAFFLGARPGGDLALLGRNLDIVAQSRCDGLVLRVVGSRVRLGRSVAAAASPEGRSTGDWMLGPLALQTLDAATMSRLGAYAQQAMLPLSWLDVVASLQSGSLLLPQLLDRPATLASAMSAGSRSGLARSGPSRTGATRSMPRDTPQMDLICSPLPLLDGPHSAACLVEPPATEPGPLTEPDPMTEPGPDNEAPRHRLVRVRLAPGADGRISLTLPEAAMQSLWSGRAVAAVRRCVLAGFGADLMVVPEDDPIGVQLGGAPLVLQPTQAGGWYGRTARGTGLTLAGEGPKSDGRGLQVELQPGRILLRGALERSLPAVPPMVDSAAATNNLARAKLMFCEALALVRTIRATASAQIELIDDAGMPLLTLPPEAAGARIRIEV